MSTSPLLTDHPPVRHRTVEGAGGCELHVRDHGPEDAPAVLFLHGLLMTGLVWQDQVAALADDHRVVTVDLRGHGRSDRPGDESYASSATWAQDVDAVVRDLVLDGVVLVAWSYAGLVAADYLRQHGDADVAGVCLVAPLRKVGTEEAMGLLGGEFLALVEGLLSTEVDVSVTTTAAFVDLARATPWPDAQRDQRLGGALSVPPAVRGAMLARELDHDDTWVAVEVPTMVAYGSQDAIIDPSSSAQLADLVPGAQVRCYDGAGHAVFTERPDAFAEDLRAFVTSCQDG